MFLKNEDKIIKLIKEKSSLAELAAEMPKDSLQFIVDMISPPFPIETQEDKELITFLYLTSLIKHIYVENEGRDENGRFIYFPELFWMLESVYDMMPQYRTSRFFEPKESMFPEPIKSVETFVF